MQPQTEIVPHGFTVRLYEESGNCHIHWDWRAPSGDLYAFPTFIPNGAAVWLFDGEADPVNGNYVFGEYVHETSGTKDTGIKWDDRYNAAFGGHGSPIGGGDAVNGYFVRTTADKRQVSEMVAFSVSALEDSGSYSIRWQADGLTFIPHGAAVWLFKGSPDPAHGEYAFGQYIHETSGTIGTGIEWGSGYSAAFGCNGTVIGGNDEVNGAFTHTGILQ